MQTAANVSAKAMRGITLYEPTEMVMSARAGTPLSQIESDLADRGQMLAFEPVELGPLVGSEAGQATIGGVFATNISGARRISAGAARDHLLGVRAVNGRGEVFKSGGRVMKNVTGVDLCRGLSGSWGTLAVLSEVTFKVLPVPEDTATVVILGLPDEFAVEALCTAMSSPFEVSGAVHLQPALAARLEHEGLRSQGKAVTALRLENFAKSVAYRRGKLKELLKAYGELHELDRENSLQLWGELRRLSVLQSGHRAGLAHFHRAHGRAEGGGRDHRLYAMPRLLRLVGRARLGRAAAHDRCRRGRCPARHRHARGSRHIDPRRAARAGRRRGVSTARARSGKTFTPAEGRVRSGRHSQSRPHVSRFLRNQSLQLPARRSAPTARAEVYFLVARRSRISVRSLTSAGSSGGFGLASSCLLSRFIAWMTRNRTAATITKLTAMVRNCP